MARFAEIILKTCLYFPKKSLTPLLENHLLLPRTYIRLPFAVTNFHFIPQYIKTNLHFPLNGRKGGGL